MMPGPGNYLAGRINGNLYPFWDILAVVLLIEDPQHYKTIYIFRDSAQNPEQQAANLETLVNKFSENFLKPDQRLPGYHRFIARQGDLSLIRVLSGPYVAGPNYHTIARDYALRQMMELVINPR